MSINTDYPKIVQAMLDPGFYPEKPEKIQMIQTQMSFVFLSGEYAYKIKKPVNLGYLDYSSLNSRYHYCQNELNLNRRLCPEVYLEVLPVSRHDGKICLGEIGEVIDYTLKMRRLPQEKMLNVLLERDHVSEEMVELVAKKISEFHKLAETNQQISTYGNILSIRGNIEENFNQTEKSIGRTISKEKYQQIRQYTSEYLVKNRPLFENRVNTGKIRDCHGDLHAAHICFTNNICIYDCIEFNDRFRYGDVASEVSFLAMDLDHFGRADLSSIFVNSYVNFSNDPELLKLLAFYKCYRAYVRGKVESFKLDDSYISEPDKKMAASIAHGYFDLAGFYIRPHPTLFITIGVTGTGKTTVAKELARHTGAVVISSDIVRKKLAGIPLTERHLDDFNTGLYSSQVTQNTYDAIFMKAEHYLSQRQSVILDATFTKHSFRTRAQELSERYHTEYLMIECFVNKENIVKRLEDRMRTNSVSDGRLEILENQITQFEPIGDKNDVRIVIDTSGSLEDNIKQILSKLQK
jgi:hypothetical protein